MSAMTVFHGSDHVVANPQFGLGKPYNDYGQGFYCTRERTLAGEWACKTNRDGFVNQYELDTRGLETLDLLDGTHSVLHWIALLLANRTFTLSSEIAQDARSYLLDHFLEDTSRYDLVIGYRADDSYFSFAESFVENGLSVRKLEEALHLGKLGTQVALMSERAFSQLRFVGSSPADRTVYYPRFITRDEAARADYRTKVRAAPNYLDDVFVLDLMRAEGGRP